MASNHYFNNFTNSMEQDLIESLIVETMGIYGHSISYCPRTIVHMNEIFGEDPISAYNHAYTMDVYIRSYDNYEGDGTFLSKFNLEIRDQVKFSVARRTFANEVGVYQSLDRPQEGDLIYSDMMQRLFVIKYVDNTPTFYQMGSLQTWDIVCEVFEYSSEHLDTGVVAIDNIERDFSINMENQGILTNDLYMITDQSGFALILGQFSFDAQEQDVFADNDEIAFAANTVVDWSVVDPFQEGGLI